MARKLPSAKADVTPAKAKQILSDGETRGTPLSKPQKGMFGAIAGGAPTKASKAPPKKASKAPPRKAQSPGVGGMAIGQRRRGGMMPPPLA
jgi:topoisomerase IA-like protein